MKQKLLFVCGFPSGGTDLTKTVINAHPEINLSGEMPFLVDLLKEGYDHSSRFSTVEEIDTVKDILRSGDTWANIRNLDYDFTSLLKEKEPLSLTDVMSHVFVSEYSTVWGNKTPQNTENMLRLHRLFPDAYFLIVTRDVRDIGLSWSKKWGKSMLWCADKWNRRMQQGIIDSRIINTDRTLFIKFEDLLSDSQTTCQSICSFLGLTFSEQMLEHDKHTKENLDGKLNYGKALKSDNQNKWRAAMSTGKAKRIEEIAYDAMSNLGYKHELATFSQCISRIERLRGKVNDMYALLFVGNRALKNNTFGYRINNVLHEVRKKLK